MRPADIFFALLLGLQHSPICRQLNEDFNEKQPNRWFHRFHCRCDFFEKLDRALLKSIGEDVKNGIRRDLDD